MQKAELKSSQAHFDTATAFKRRWEQHGAGKPREPAAGTATLRSAGVRAGEFWLRPAAIPIRNCAMPRLRRLEDIGLWYLRPSAWSAGQTPFQVCSETQLRARVLHVAPL
jgi:hypothetical protein